jgi:hypothetical protein
VLNASTHVSYPNVFEWDGSIWMVPEANNAKGVALYRAVTEADTAGGAGGGGGGSGGAAFPMVWKFEKFLLTGAMYVDPTIFRAPATDNRTNTHTRTLNPLLAPLL